MLFLLPNMIKFFLTVATFVCFNIIWNKLSFHGCIKNKRIPYRLIKKIMFWWWKCILRFDLISILFFYSSQLFLFSTFNQMGVKNILFNVLPTWMTLFFWVLKYELKAIQTDLVGQVILKFAIFTSYYRLKLIFFI